MVQSAKSALEKYENFEKDIKFCEMHEATMELFVEVNWVASENQKDLTPAHLEKVKEAELFMSHFWDETMVKVTLVDWEEIRDQLKQLVAIMDK